MANRRSCVVVRYVLNRFVAISGLKTNPVKSSWLASKSVSEQEKATVVDWLDIPMAVSFDKYLRFPITSSRARIVQYDYLIKKIRCPLNGWRTKLLNKVGRVTLARAEVYLQFPLMQCKSHGFPKQPAI